MYFCIDNFLKLGGKLGFLITQTIFKTKGAGEGFRGFELAQKNIPFQVSIVHDLVKIKPFDSSNMTAIIIVQKGKTTEYPVPYIKWNLNNIKKITDHKDFYRKTIKHELLASPIDKKNKKSPWITLPRELLPLKELVKESDYIAHLGMNSGGANGVYWVKILSKSNDIVEIENRIDQGKKKVEKIISKIESNTVFPVIKSKHLNKWKVINTDIYTILSQDIDSRKGYKDLKKELPKTYQYLLHFKDILVKRAAYKKYFKESDPFYSMFNVSRKLFSPYKVVWRRMGKKLEAAVATSQSDEYWNDRIIIPDNVLSFIPLKNEEEAHYICAIINSKLITLILNSFSVSGAKSFGTPSILKNLNIKKFENKPPQLQLAKLSKKLHESIIKNDLKDIPLLEKDIDEIVFNIYEISDEMKSFIINYS